MTVMDFLLLLLIAGICGSIAVSLSGFTSVGCLGAIALGFIGALFGNYLSRQLNLPDPLMVSVGGSAFPVVWSVIGATLFVTVLGLIRRAGSGPVVDV